MWSDETKEKVANIGTMEKPQIKRSPNTQGGIPR